MSGARGVEELAERLKTAGLSDLVCRIHPQGRHRSGFRSGPDPI